jgi:hypothetical protein
MGTDIKIIAEIKINEKWAMLSGNETFIDVPRCYAFFAILADRRNGPNTNYKEKFNSIVPESRGLPADISDETKKYIDDWWGSEYISDWDNSTFSWVTLGELVDYDYSQKIFTSEGNAETYEEAAGGIIKLIKKNITSQIKYIDFEGNKKTDIRLIFWFD